MRIRIDHAFTTLNNYINAERRNRYIGAKIKKDETEVAIEYFEGLEIPTPCKVHFTWFQSNKRKDLDNIAFAKKFILDGAVKAGAIANDSQKYIVGFTDELRYDDREYVEVEFEEMK